MGWHGVVGTPQVAILGRPNVGKSSLMNRWTNTDRAIVTDIAGTTRDIVEGALSVGGVPVTLLDTAGIRSTADAVETIGVERARRAARDADLVLWVVNAAEGVTDDDFEVLRSIRGAGGAAPGPGSTGGAARAARAPVVLGVANKVDLAPDFSVDRIPAEAAAGCQVGDGPGKRLCVVSSAQPCDGGWTLDARRGSSPSPR